MKAKCISPLPSQLIANLQDRLKQHVHGGVYLSSADVCALVNKLKTIQGLLEIEEELRVPDQQFSQAGNVIRPDFGRKP